MSPDLQWLSAVVVYIDLPPHRYPPTSYPKTPTRYLGKPCRRDGASYHHLHPVLHHSNPSGIAIARV